MLWSTVRSGRPLPPPQRLSPVLSAAVVRRSGTARDVRRTQWAMAVLRDAELDLLHNAELKEAFDEFDKVGIN